MHIARLLALVLFMGAAASAQVEKQSAPLAGPVANLETGKSAEETARQPWQIFPDQKPDATVLLSPRGQAGNHNAPFGFPFHPNFDQQTVFIGPGRQSTSDDTCYAIRSYVVARDEKDSDSTHPVSSSTCQLAGKYQLKNVRVPLSSADR